MKKKISVSILAALMVVSGGQLANAKVVSESFNITINGQKYVTPAGEQKPYQNQDYRTMVPVRFISNALGVSNDRIFWDQGTQTVGIQTNKAMINIKIGSDTIYASDGTSILMDTKAELINDRTFIPARYVAQLLAARVEWDQATQTVKITTSGPVNLPKPPAVVVNPTNNSNNLIDNADGTKSLGNIAMPSSFTSGQSDDETKSYLELFSKVSFSINGDSITISVPDSGTSRLWWTIQDANGHNWEGSEAKTMSFSGTKAVEVSLDDHNVGKGLADVIMIYNNGVWTVKYPVK